LGFVALNPTYILPVLLRNAKPNNGRFPNRASKVSFLIRLALFFGQRPRSYETSLPNFDGFVRIPDFVMPDLIRYPEYAEITGFRPSPE
jgi:hypothetical protein